MERSVTLAQVLDAREARAKRQEKLLEAYRLPVISFTMNIAGPVKNSPVLRRAFQEGLERLALALQGADIGIVTQEQVDQPTGCEALLTVKGDGRAVKVLCTELEDEDALGRLFDLDVLTLDRGKWDREQLGLGPRRCLICGREGKGCASRRLHTVEELQRATQKILWDYFSKRDRDTVASLAARALLYEVCTTPKPGLVDRTNNGSHRDMDLFTFSDSTTALYSYWGQAVAVGQETAEQEPQETFRKLRRLGVRAERTMFRATGGVNTHKGAIFSLGTVCSAVGRLWTPAGVDRDVAAILRECGRMSADATETDLKMLTWDTAETMGQRLYLEHGLRGIRGEVADGLPSVEKIGLPVLKELLAQGVPLEEAGVTVLLHLMAGVTDTNLIARGGWTGQQWAAEQARALLDRQAVPKRQAVEALDRELIARNLSPGGCADLLAITYFLHFYSQKKELRVPFVRLRKTYC